MVFITPYVMDKYTAYLEDTITTSLSMAIWLIDDHTREGPIGNVKVRIKDRNIKPIKNHSGYYLFTDLDDGDFTVDVESDFYFHEERTVDTSKIILEFDSTGPASDTTEVKLKDVSRLTEGDIVEFRNNNSETEQKTITEIDVDNKTISWAERLTHDFISAGSTIRSLKDHVVEILLRPRPAYPFSNNATLVRGLILDTGPADNAKVEVVGKTIQTIIDERGEFVLYFKGIGEENITIKIKKNGVTKSVETIIKERCMVSVGIIPFP